MTAKLVIISVIAVTASLLFVAFGLSASTPPQPVPVNQVKLSLTVDEVQTDLSGRVMSTATRTSSDTISSPTPAARPGGTDVTLADPKHATGGGCATITPHVTATDPLFFYTYWRYYAPAHWCWPYVGGNMSWYPQNPYFKDSGYGWCCSDPSYSVNGYFYTWRGNAQAGHYAYRRGKISETVIPTGIVVGDIYPVIEIWTTGPYWTVHSSRGY